MCKCKNIKIGSYGNQVELPVPVHMYPLRNVLGEDKPIQAIYVDRCLADEIQSLWNNGITTTGCCCGHNLLLPYIGVIEEDWIRMIELGYIMQAGNFIPKSIYPEKVYQSIETKENAIMHYSEYTDEGQWFYTSCSIIFEKMKGIVIPENNQKAQPVGSWFKCLVKDHRAIRGTFLRLPGSKILHKATIGEIKEHSFRFDLPLIK